MYHTFQASTAASNPADGDAKEGSRTASRRISTSNACVECRRRKIRCDGTQPCGQCNWYQHPELCTYSKPQQRVVPSRKLVDNLNASNKQYQLVLDRLFPNRDIESLLCLPREELINLALTLPAATTSPPQLDPVPAPASTTPRSDDADSLDALEQAPDQDPVLDEAKRHRDKVQGISDDVNGLSLSVDKPSSYVGASSITAALKVIFKTAPAARRFVAHSHTDTALPSRANTPPPNLNAPNPNPTYLPPAEIGQALIESYFNHIHALMPMIDEHQFWHTWLYGERKDAPWLALLNTVFALGSLASSNSDSDQHIAYFQRARQHLELESLGSGNLLVLQALALLSGYYLHYVNRPNLANNLMGATLRMATVLGLHREYTEPTPSKNPNLAFTTDAIPAEIRRRTWWSLFCLDAWASTTTGRPSLGRLGAGITVRPPHTSNEKLNVSQHQASLRHLPLIHNVAFCKLATRIQDALATSPLLKFDELVGFDAELVRWHDELPSILLPIPAHQQGMPAGRERRRNESFSQQQAPKLNTPSSATGTFDFAKPPEMSAPSNSCPEFLKTPRAIMHWRYQNLRIVLHRPFLLATALRRTPYILLSAEEKVAVGRCRIIASQTITDISNLCEEELIAGWNAVWFMYQAVMVPLVSVFSTLSSNAQSSSNGESNPNTDMPDAAGSASAMSSGGDDDVRKWEQQIQTAMAFFDRMTHWSVAARKSKEVVSRLYEASKGLSEYNAMQQQHQQQQHERHHQQQQIMLAQAQQFNGTALSEADGDSYAATQSAELGSTQGNVDGMAGQSMWGLSPNGDAAMNNFWWDDMMWDFPLEGPEMPENSGTGFGMGDVDWLSTFDGQNSNEQTWNFTQQE